MAEFAVMTMGADQPGIVAAVTGVLHEHGGNVLDSSMTILGGWFTLALLVEVDDVDAATLDAAIDDATVDLDLRVGVHAIEPGTATAAPTHLLSVYGADHPGIVAGVSRALADVGANVTDLSARVLGDDPPVYAMVVELTTDDESSVSGAMAAVADGLGVDWTLRPFDDVTY